MINGVNSSGTPNNPKYVHTQNRVFKSPNMETDRTKKKKNRNTHV